MAVFHLCLQLQRGYSLTVALVNVLQLKWAFARYLQPRMGLEQTTSKRCQHSNKCIHSAIQGVTVYCVNFHFHKLVQDLHSVYGLQ